MSDFMTPGNLSLTSFVRILSIIVFEVFVTRVGFCIKGRYDCSAACAKAIVPLGSRCLGLN